MPTAHGLASPTAHVGSGEKTVSAIHEGVVAGLLGAGALAVWFLIVDVIQGRPFYTPSMLGTALFKGDAVAASLRDVAPSFEMTVSFTWVHALAFVVLGLAAARLLSLAEKNPNLGFGVLLLFVIFQAGFTFATVLFAQGVLDALGWPSVFAGNLVAAGVMAAYFWRQHRGIDIRP